MRLCHVWAQSYSIVYYSRSLWSFQTTCARFGIGSDKSLLALLSSTIPYSRVIVQNSQACCGQRSDRLVYRVSLKKFSHLTFTYTTLYTQYMKRYYILFRIPNQSIPYTDKPNSPWKLFWCGEDPEKAWRNYGLFQKDSPIRVYRNQKVQIREITFRSRPPEVSGDKPEDYDYAATR